VKGLAPEGRGGSGILMSLNLFNHLTSTNTCGLHLLSAYESGEVMLRRYTDSSRDISIEGRGWECLWKSKEHVESVMAMTVSHDHSFALTTSADHFIVRYNLTESSPDEWRSPEKDEGRTNKCETYTRSSKHKTKQPGSGAIALRGDDRVCAVGGWDGKIRLYSTKSFKPLGTLAYHSKNCQAVAFANSNPPSLRIASDEEDDEMTEEEKEARSRWLAAGSQDNRLSIWELMEFGKNSDRTADRENSHRNVS